MTMPASIERSRATRERRHIRLADYDVYPGEEPTSSTEEELAALPADAKKPEHHVVIDCPDCGRTIAIHGRCRKCAGRSWLPAGYVDRAWIKRVRAAESSEGEGTE